MAQRMQLYNLTISQTWGTFVGNLDEDVRLHDLGNAWSL